MNHRHNNLRLLFTYRTHHCARLTIKVGHLKSIWVTQVKMTDTESSKAHCFNAPHSAKTGDRYRRLTKTLLLCLRQKTLIPRKGFLKKYAFFLGRK